MKLVWLDDAIQDLQSLHEYIKTENPEAARQVVKRILASVTLLPNQSAMGREGRVHNTRELIVAGTPFIIPYRVKNKNIEILRVFHGAMRWQEE